MPSNLQTLRIVDPVLSTVARGYSNDSYIGDIIFPVVEVDKEGGKIPSWGKESFKIYDTYRGVGADSNKMKGRYASTIPFELNEHDIALPLDYRQIQESQFNYETIAVQDVMDAIMVKREKIIADLVQDVNQYPTDNKVDLADDYFNEDAIDWIKYVRAKKAVIRSIIGKYPNLLWMGPKVWELVRDHPLLKKYLVVDTSVSNVTATLELLAKVLEIDQVVVGNATYTDDGETFSDIWGNYMGLIFNTPPSGVARTPYQPCFGYTIRKRGNPYSDKYDTEGGKIHNVRTTDNYDEVFVGSESGFLIKDPIDPAVFAA